jgi:hypothetical protein
LSRAGPAVPALVLAIVALAVATAAMPPQPGASGLDGSCRDCHHGEPGASVGADLSIEGVPKMYESRKEYTIRVVLERGSGPFPYYQVLHAFQLGVSDGTLRVVDQGALAINGTEVGSRGGTSATEWTVVWTAPETDPDVEFFAEAIVADGDGSEGGDVYLRAFETSYGPLDVPPEDEPGPWYLREMVVVVAIAALVIGGLSIAFARSRGPPRSEDD